MAVSPQRIRETTFRTARKGYDQGEVDSFVHEVATALEVAQNDATAMEARARAAVARLQELSQADGSTQTADSGAGDAGATATKSHVEESETISRTLLLAQRTADQTVADATAEADRVLAAARDEATTRLDDARDEATRMIDEAKSEARQAGEGERVRVEGEVQALLARRDFLESDVDHLEEYLAAQRERLTEAASELQALVERVPGGLGELRRPVMSAAERPSDEPAAADGEASEISEISRIAGVSADDELPPPDDDTGELARRQASRS